MLFRSEVRTERGTYHAARLIVTAGAWATRLLADLGVPLTVMRQVLLWYSVVGREHLFAQVPFGFAAFWKDIENSASAHVGA